MSCLAALLLYTDAQAVGAGVCVHTGDAEGHSTTLGRAAQGLCVYEEQVTALSVLCVPVSALGVHVKSV